MAWCSSLSRFSAVGFPDATPAASLTKTASTSASTASGGTCLATAMALIGLPSAIMLSSSSSAGRSPPGEMTGWTRASTMAGSSAVPPVATARIASASWLPSATRSFSR